MGLRRPALLMISTRTPSYLLVRRSEGSTHPAGAFSRFRLDFLLAFLLILSVVSEGEQQSGRGVAGPMVQAEKDDESGERRE